MKTLKTIAIATIAIIATTLASCSTNEPEMPATNHSSQVNNKTTTTGHYAAIARLTVNDSIAPFVESVQVVYTLPGEQEQTETVTLRKMQSTDLEAKALTANGVDINRCSIAALEKHITTPGEVKMRIVLNIDSTRPVYAEHYDALVLPVIAAGKVQNNELPQCDVQVSIQSGLKSDHLIEYLTRRAGALREKTFEL